MPAKIKAPKPRQELTEIIHESAVLFVHAEGWLLDRMPENRSACAMIEEAMLEGAKLTIDYCRRDLTKLDS